MEVRYQYWYQQNLTEAETAEGLGEPPPYPPPCLEVGDQVLHAANGLAAPGASSRKKRSRVRQWLQHLKERRGCEGRSGEAFDPQGC